MTRSIMRPSRRIAATVASATAAVLIGVSLGSATDSANKIASIAPLAAAPASSLADNADTHAAAGANAEQEPTYYRDVRPVLVQNCLRCHNDAGVSWSMNDPEETYARRRRIARAIGERHMPPWLAEDGHQQYVGNPMLADYVVNMVQRWRDSDFPKGDAVPDPVVTASAGHGDNGHGPSHGSFNADLSLDVLPNGSYLPNQTRSDDYRCFVVDWTPKSEAFITGFRAVPGNKKVAHHFVVFAIQPSLADRFRELADAEEGEGYQCFGGAVPDRLGNRANRTEYESRYPQGVRELSRGNFWLAHWAPGMDGHVFPAGTGIRVQPGSVLVVQLHYYTKDAEGERDQGSRLDFMTSPTVTRPAFHLAQTNNDWMNGDQPGSIIVPPGDTASVSLTEDLGDYLGYIANITGVPRDRIDALELHSANLHMHGVGHSGEVTLERDGTEREMLLAIPRWDLGWQRDFTFTKPKVFTRDQIAGTKLRVRCTYFNPKEQPVYGGLGSEEEMCFNFSYIAVRQGDAGPGN